MNIKEATEQLIKLQSKQSAYAHAMELIYYDGATTAPKGTAENRAHALSILSEEVYLLGTSEETVELLTYLNDHKDELDQKTARMVYLMYKDIQEMKKIPMDEYIAFQELQVKSEDVWHTAKEENDFASFLPYLEQMFAYKKKFAGYIAPEKDPYDYWLSEFEGGLDRATCDEFFGSLKESIVPLIHKIGQAEQVDNAIIKGSFPEDEQEKLSYYLMELMGLDLTHVGLSTTEHPFTIGLGSHHDVRITTNYDESDVSSSMFSVIHEGGHALYDTNSDDEYAYTVLDQGVSMGIHESQSRFYENLIGRSKAFVSYIFPKLQEIFPEQMKGYTADDFYKAINRVEPSLIRTEADEVTYSLHVMIRYEIEKAVFAGELEVKDIPAVWNQKYKEYLGVDVPDDTHGVLQDSHWSGGAIGYFPSYALGSAYGAQLLKKMKEEVAVDEEIARGRFDRVNAWNREHIWTHGCLYTPKELLENALGEAFSPDSYVEYLTEKYSEIYGL